MEFTKPFTKSWKNWGRLGFPFQNNAYLKVKNTEFLRLVERLTYEIRDRDFDVYFDSSTSKWISTCMGWIFDEFSFLIEGKTCDHIPVKEFALRIRKWGAVNERAIYAASVLEALSELEFHYQE